MPILLPKDALDRTGQAGQDSDQNSQMCPTSCQGITVGSQRSLSPSIPALAAPEAPCPGHGVHFDELNENNKDNQNKVKLHGS